MFDSELDDFKTKIDIRAYAAAHGYQESKKESWKGSDVMRHPVTDDKIVVKRNTNNHYVWISNHNNTGGSIIDFVMLLHRVNLGTARKELRPWLGKPPVPVPLFSPLHKTPPDRTRVEAIYARLDVVTATHPYLEQQRALPSSLLVSDRFMGRIRIDGRGNAVFPHFDADGLCGYELKNSGFTGFSSGGIKALWLSHEFPDDNRLVITESAIDALSHAVLFPDLRARYASIGGKPNAAQSEIIRSAAARLPGNSEVVSAMDADEAGKMLNNEIRKAVALTGRFDLQFSVHVPSIPKDWNDQLRKRPEPFLPYRPDVPSVA